MRVGIQGDGEARQRRSPRPAGREVGVRGDGVACRRRGPRPAGRDGEPEETMKRVGFGVPGQWAVMGSPRIPDKRAAP